MVKDQGEAAVSLQPMEVNGKPDFHLQPLEQLDAQRRMWPHGKPALEQAPGRTWGPMDRESHKERDLLSELVILQGTYTGEAHSCRIAPRWENP
ncbi:hypothetical protein WISP_89052 [Willisornis vidua]|uniref:Uncharacterized protein n=1 Tax=Willisornis vidua TaxID=1566151 RepID=A0ABQ9D1Z0_9PASS|nr:hypothetical protein WISP_89052 [Willisornis vidua]